MKSKPLLLWLWVLISLAGCNLPSSGQTAPLGATATPSLTPTPFVATHTFTPTPTPIPAVRVETGDRALFDGDYARARSEYQIAYSTSTDPQVRAAALWGLGRTEYEAGVYASALEALRRLSVEFPDSQYAAYAFFLLGETYASLQRYAEAADAYSSYLSLRPGVIDAYAQEWRGDALVAAGNDMDAVVAYQTALAAPHLGDGVALQIKLAQAYANSGDSATALGMYDEIAAKTGNDFFKAQMDFLAGQTYLSLGQNSQAYERFLHAVDNYPHLYDTYSGLVVLVEAGVPVDDLNRGLVDYYAGKYGVALAAFDRYISANPQNDGTVHFYRAKALDDSWRYEEAVAEYTLFINNYPDNLHWQAAWDEKAGTQWYYLEQYEAASQTYLDFVAAMPASPDAPRFLLNAGQMLERAGRLEEAATTWERIPDRYPSSDLVPQALFWAGIARYRNANPDGALVAFQRNLILASAPEDQARAYFWIGKTQQKRGDAAAAQTAWQQAAGLDLFGYYSERARDTLFGKSIFQPPPAYNLTFDLAADRREAEAWIRIQFNLPSNTDLSSPGALLQDLRLSRGTELWNLGLYDEARLEFEDLRQAVSEDPADSYRLGNYLLDLGLYRVAISAIQQVLTLAGMETYTQMLTAPNYFNHVRYGFYYQDLILPAAQQNGLDPLVLFSVVWQESQFEGFVHSSAGARGLMQIMPATGASIVENMGWPPDYTADDLYRPLVSVDLGAHHLMTNRTHFGGDLYAALAAYNSWTGNAEIWKGLSGSDPDLFVEIIRFEETRNYIRNIYEIYIVYRSLYGSVP
ncbi:MAG: tetratricopeptide repeat protein [Anaerolineales bacterium]|nr:tetratricopeptide repeat protein [Anaerolineales bacterium]